MNKLLTERIPVSLTGPCLVIGSLTVFSPLIEGGTTQLPVLIIRLILLVALGSWLMAGLCHSTLVIPRTDLWWPIAAFLGWSGLSLLWSPYTNVSLQWFLSLLLYAVFFLMILLGTDSEKRLQGFLLLILLMGMFEGGLGIIQYLYGGESRAKGTFFNPNFFSTYETVSAVLAISLLWFGAEYGKTGNLLLILCATISGTAVILAQSRGGAAAFLIAITAIGYFKYGKSTLFLLLILILGTILLPNPLKQRVLEVGKQDPYAYTRIEIWEDATKRLRDHPLGIGLGMYKYASFQYRFPIDDAIIHYGKRAETAHNEYLQLAVELGIAGLACFLLSIAVWTAEIKRIWKTDLPQQSRGQLVGLCAGVLASIVHATVDSVFHEPALVLLLILEGGLAVALGKQVRGTQAEPWCFTPPYHVTRVILIMVSLGAMAYLAIQPTAAWLLVKQGNSAQAEHDNMSAIKWYRYASMADPGATAVRDGLARLCIQRFRETGAPEWLEQAASEMAVAMALNPLDGRPPYRLGTIYLLQLEQQTWAAHKISLTAQATQAFKKSISVDPFSPFGYFELSKLYRGKGDRTSAQQLLEQAITYEPNFIPARVALVDLARESGHTDVASMQLTAIQTIRWKFQDWTLTSMEQQFLGIQPPRP
ncbi:O-antigen ligase family protein [Nitrospira sp. BLG_1]|uniref:O-antigen ligase family protein n=1 Tax=Nitrospira sp. BLG_1 TaxID=3395883 RepID=UPI0039BD3B33